MHSDWTSEDVRWAHANERGRWATPDVRKHVRERISAVARTLGVNQSEALETIVQAAEAAMSDQMAARYVDELARKLSTPPGTRLACCPLGEKLPPLPEMSTPLGCGLQRTEVKLHTAAIKEQPRKGEHPADAIGRARFARMLAEVAAREAEGTEEEPWQSACRGRS